MIDKLALAAPNGVWLRSRRTVAAAVVAPETPVFELAW